MKKKNIQEQFKTDLDAEEFLEPNFNDGEDDNLDGDDYDKDEELVQKLKQLSGVKSKRLRTEIVSDELDVNVNTSSTDTKNRIKVHELIGSLKNVSNIGTIKNVLSKAHKRTKVLETPLPKHISDKAHRIAAYTTDSKEVSKWDHIVKQNRKAEQLVFPLKQPDYSMKNATEFVKTWKPETDLEKEISELLQTSENNLKDQKALTPAELKGLEAMSLEELKEKRAEYLKFKALQLYQEQKFKRMKKIKSKRYRKILRKDKEKKEQKELEKLSKENPGEFKEKLDLLEKQRMQERMSLKHKNTSKWAKQQNIYGKFNLKAREEIQEQLQLSKQLTKKLKPNNEPLEKEIQDEARNLDDKINMNLNLKLQSTTSKNPWISFVPVLQDNENDKTEKPVNTDDIYVKPKAFVNKDEIKAAQDEIENDDDTESDDDDIVLNKPKRKVEEEEESSEEEEEEDNDDDEVKNKVENTVIEAVKAPKKKESPANEKIATTNDQKSDKISSANKEIDLKKVLLAENEPNTHYDNEINEAEDEINDNSAATSLSKKEEAHRLTLSEAFADDDVVAEFRMEKKNIQDKEKVKPIDLTLPGWGGWTGAGFIPKKQNKKYKKRNNKQPKRLVIKPAPHEQLRRDKDLENVIISEKKDTKIAEYQISELPHQFNNVEAFEKKISQPIGRTWNPESKYRKLVQPKVVTRVGKIIEPIEKDDVVLNKKRKNRKIHFIYCFILLIDIII